MSWTEIENALDAVIVNKNDWVDDDGQPLAITIVQENEDNDRTENQVPRIELYMLPADTVSMDKNSSDEYSGILQASVFTELGDGKGLSNTIKDQIIALYPHLPSINTANCEISIDAVSGSNGRVDGKFWRVDCSISWFAYVARL